jgi:hypothetical protein
MLKRQIVCVAVAAALCAAAIPAPLAGQQGAGQITGTADKEAKKPYDDYVVRARAVRAGQIAATVNLDPSSAVFSVAGLVPDIYMIELVNRKNGKVVCTEGPFELTNTAITKTDVVIDCQKIPVAWLLVGAAAATGIPILVTQGGTASASQ